MKNDEVSRVEQGDLVFDFWEREDLAVVEDWEDIVFAGRLMAWWMEGGVVCGLPF